MFHSMLKQFMLKGDIFLQRYKMHEVGNSCQFLDAFRAYHFNLKALPNLESSISFKKQLDLETGTD